MTQDRDTTDRELKVKVAEYPVGFRGDVADLLSTPGGPAAFGAMIRNARPGPSWMIAHVDEVMGRDLTTVDGKAAACEDVVDTLLSQPPIARSAYVRELAERLEVAESDVRRTLNQVLRERAAYYEQHPNERPKPSPVWARDAL